MPATTDRCINFAQNPVMINNMCGYFTQLIWQATTQFGCAYSARTGTSTEGDFHVLSCCWDPPGNDAVTFADNVKPDI